MPTLLQISEDDFEEAYTPSMLQREKQLEFVPDDLDVVEAADREAVRNAVIRLVDAHRTELELYVSEERRRFGIESRVRSGWKDWLDRIREYNGTIHNKKENTNE